MIYRYHLKTCIFYFFAPRLSLVVFLVLPYEESNVALGKKWRRENMRGVLMLYSAYLMKAKIKDIRLKIYSKNELTMK